MARKSITDYPFAQIYPLLVTKVTKKGRTQEEADQLISWLTGYSAGQIHALETSDIPYGAFFENAPSINPDFAKIQGKICGVRVEEITDPTIRLIRVLDLMIDQLAKGKSVEAVTHPRPKAEQSVKASVSYAQICMQGRRKNG